jgi:UDP-N-acetylglucosamine 2-epimerase (non-hydrolysing)/GDP/UDP-N,N'-diacetylbacillosamine 2-epimerase (hydrolysing)
LDFIRRAKLLSCSELEESLNFKFRSINLLITFHPATLDPQPAEVQFKELLTALDRIKLDIGLIFTKPNSDVGGRSIIRAIDSYIGTHSHAQAYTSLGQIEYLSVMSSVDAVVGNSSSGLYEAPSFGKPTVNIGDRQKGRIQATSVINCAPEASSIERAILQALSLDCSGVQNPYGDGNASVRIKDCLKGVSEPDRLLKKHFFELSSPHA